MMSHLKRPYIKQALGQGRYDELAVKAFDQGRYETSDQTLGQRGYDEPFEQPLGQGVCDGHSEQALVRTDTMSPLGWPKVRGDMMSILR